ncbi:NAD(P)/FAD-dependent oxidoreductase [Synechococcus sp. PCC 7336]|uniref:phytoene desaturase family protein n=1 Tax=Synechococcus sp. PCC 7336 TaxID=195250 RepID=UPI00034C55CF|nr:NAD(P)/FAD-dependent oxidoreductase [Synechococcus sp. PCC 7336]
MSTRDAIAIGSGIGGLVSAALLARYGWNVTVCESHTIPGGAAHAFEREGYCFDSGPSFFAGLSDPHSLNPLRQVLDVLDESVAAIAYDPLGHYHFPEGSFPVYSNLSKYREAVAAVTPQGARELAQFEARLLRLYDVLSGVPALHLRGDWQVFPVLMQNYLPALAKLLPQLGAIQGSVGQVMDRYVRDRWVRRPIDLECFLLSGLKAHGTVTPEMAFMYGERDRSVIDYPIGGSGAIVAALVRGLEKWGGKLRLRSHVSEIQVEGGRAVGVRLQSGEAIEADAVISNATVWDTYATLIDPKHLPERDRQAALETPAVHSFMHLHLGIRAEGLEGLSGHHVVVGDGDIAAPGNTCMISIPTVWDTSMAPPGCHAIHAYTLEPFEGWTYGEGYEEKKRSRVQVLYRALKKVIPNIRDRVQLELIGTPLTHARFLRRDRGTYGPAIAAGAGTFPGCQTPIRGLYRAGDSTMPGIGVPAVAASGILCANALVSTRQTAELVQTLRDRQARAGRIS